jgi:AraC-like DNA-binding protein
MDSSSLLELLARGAAVGAFIGLAILVIRGEPSPARATAALFSIAAAAHTVTQMPGVALNAALGWLWFPIWAFSVMGGGLLWAFALELFEDRKTLSISRFVPSALLLTLGTGAAWAQLPTARPLWLAHQLVSAAVIAHALFIIAAGWRGDLVEARRRLRGPILIAAGLYALAVVAVETGELFMGPASALSPLAAAALLALSLSGLAAFGRADETLFGPAAVPEAVTEAAIIPALNAEDAAHAAALDKLMKDDRIYREENLMIGAIALKLRLPEHRLRRLINQRLGYRSFSAFLNQWRLAEAKQALSDPAQASVPISTIAFDAGFGSLGPFNRAFKAETGLTPSEFRAQALGCAGDAGLQATPKPAT